jgi:hypothetical protein
MMYMNIAATKITEHTPTSLIECRQHPDRRRHLWRAIAYGACCGQRRGDRRQDALKMQYVDIYGLPLFISSLGIFILCCLDAYFTLELLRIGAKEINPFMDMLLREDIRSFLNIKFTFTAISLLFLVLHKNFLLCGWLKIESIIHMCFGAYFSLILYEMTLLSF